MTARTLELFGDWLVFDGERIAELRLSPAKRMLLVETLAVLDGPHVDFRGSLDRTEVVLNALGRIVGQHHPGPPLPDDYATAVVVKLDDVVEALQNADIEVTT
jgi:hypothetical protein